MSNIDKIAKDRIKESGDFISNVTTPQINAYTQQYNQFQKEIIFNAAVIIAAGVALLSSDVDQIRVLSILGLILLVFSVVLSILGFRKTLVESSEYILLLKKLQELFTERSSLPIQMKQEGLDIDDYQEKDRKIVNKIYSLRNDPVMDRAKNTSHKFLENINKPLSELNLTTFTFATGLLLIGFSIFLPQICLLF